MGEGQSIGDIIKNKFKQAGKNVGKAMLKKLKFLTPYIAIGIGILLIASFILCLFIDAGSIGVKALDESYQNSSVAAWEQFIRYLHIAEGGGSVTKNSSGEDCYTVQNGAVGYGVDIATHGDKLRAQGYDTSEGSLIPVSVVDPIENEVVKARYNDIENLVNANGIQLTQYQIFALVSRTYNYGFSGGTGQATGMFKYPSTLTFVEAYKQYYASIDNESYYGDYTKTDFSNGLFTQYMTWLDYANTGTHPDGWETRRKSEWCLFQTGYYGWGLQNNAYPQGFDEYWVATKTLGVDLYNADGPVNEDKMQELEYALEDEHNIIKSGKGFNNWVSIPEGDTDNETRRKVTGTFHGFSGEVRGGTPRGNNGLSTYQCTWWANGRASEFLSVYGTKYKSYPSAEGNGGQYYVINKNRGWFKYGSEPKPNSLLSTSSSSGEGHVLYIEAVDYKNRVYYASEAGSGYKWGGICKYSFGHHTCNDNYGFIYLDEPN